LLAWRPARYRRDALRGTTPGLASLQADLTAGRHAIGTGTHGIGRTTLVRRLAL
jgi:hypothetical protein